MGLEQLAAYPFERLNELLKGVKPGDSVIDATIGEPQHTPPQFIIDAHNAAVAQSIGKYPKTRQIPELSRAIAGYAQRNLGVELNEGNILALCGSGEGLASMPSFAMNLKGKKGVVMPTPGYAVYHGASVLAGAKPMFAIIPISEQQGFKSLSGNPNYLQESVSLVYINYPNNPMSVNAERKTLERAITLAQEQDFVLASDECYNDIYFAEDLYGKPLSVLAVAKEMGIKDFHNILSFQSLSKRSSVPGLRSGFMAGDPKLIEQYSRMRMMERKTMPVHVQLASAAAWNDDEHVEANRKLYDAKRTLFMDTVDSRFYNAPQGTFYIWFGVPTSTNSRNFARNLFEETGIKVLPGAYLDPSGQSYNADTHVRIALVHDMETTKDLAQRLQSFIGGC